MEGEAESNASREDADPFEAAHKMIGTGVDRLLDKCMGLRCRL